MFYPQFASNLNSGKSQRLGKQIYTGEVKVQTYPSGNPRVHIQTPAAVINDAIDEYREKIDDGTLADTTWFEGLILDLKAELDMRQTKE